MTSIQSTTPDIFGATTQNVSAIQQLLQNATNDSESDTADISTNVEISPEAQAKLDRLETDRAVAEKLAKALAPSASQEAEATTLDDITGADKTKYLTLDDLVANQGGESDDDGSLQGITLTDEQQASMRDAIASLMVHSVEHRDPKAAQALREAIENDTVVIRKAEDVPGANLKTTVTTTQGPYGSGMTTHKDFNPSPEIQAEIDSGHATTMWSKNQGDLYITW